MSAELDALIEAGNALAERLRVCLIVRDDVIADDAHEILAEIDVWREAVRQVTT